MVQPKHIKTRGEKHLARGVESTLSLPRENQQGKITEVFVNHPTSLEKDWHNILGIYQGFISEN